MHDAAEALIPLGFIVVTEALQSTGVVPFWAAIFVTYLCWYWVGYLIGRGGRPNVR